MRRIFKWFVQEGGHPKALSYATWFVRNFEPKDFDGVDRMLTCYLKYCANLSITPKKEFLSAYLKVDGKQDIKKYSVHVDTMTSLDYRESSQLDEAYQIISEVTQTAYDSYIGESLDGRDFKVDMYDYMSERRAERIQSVMMQSYPKLTDGTPTEEVSQQLRADLSSIDDTYNFEKLKEIDLTSSSTDTDDDEMEFLCKTGVPCIDGDIGGIYTKLIYTINGQPGGGKTQFAFAHFVYKVLVEAKKDVLVYELEMSKGQVRNILIAYHIIQIYGGRIKIPFSLMNKKSEMTNEQRQIYESAKIDLFESGNYGNLFIKKDLVVERYQEELMDVIRSSDNLGLVCIDYMGLADSMPEDKWSKHKEQFEIITDAYEITRKILNSTNIAAVCINQYNDKGIEAAYMGKPIRSGHVQGGHIVQRHTDYDLSMTFTFEQEVAGVRSLSTSKKRGAAGFSNVLFSTDLSVAIFRQELST